MADVLAANPGAEEALVRLRMREEAARQPQDEADFEANGVTTPRQDLRCVGLHFSA
jgi:hypothetical protein